MQRNWYHRGAGFESQTADARLEHSASGPVRERPASGQDRLCGHKAVAVMLPPADRKSTDMADYQL
jgi:hypothetical protein